MTLKRGWELLAVVGLFAGCGDNREPTNADACIDGGGQTPAERGQYIVDEIYFAPWMRHEWARQIEGAA